VSALSSHRLMPMFPPNLSLYDDLDSPDSIVNPVMRLRDSFARVQAHVARLDGDEHQEQRDVLMQQLETATQELAEISPTLHSIANLRIGINSQRSACKADHSRVQAGNELTDTAGPAPFVEPFTEPYAETTDNSATDEFDATEVTVEHSSSNSDSCVNPKSRNVQPWRLEHGCNSDWHSTCAVCASVPDSLSRCHS